MGDSSRRLLTNLLAVLAAVLLLGALVVGYATVAIFDADSFSDRAASALDDEAVQDELGTVITDQLVLRAQADLVAAAPLIENTVSGIVGGGVFQSVFRSAVRDLHRAAFEHDQNTVAFTLADIGAVVTGALEVLGPKIADEVGGDFDVEITIDAPDWIADLAQVADGVGALLVLLAVLGLVAAAVALWLSPDRRRTVLLLGVAIAILGVAALVAHGVIREIVLARIGSEQVRAAIDGVWGAFGDDLNWTLFLFAGCGTVIAAAASSLLRPVDIGYPLRRSAELLGRVPERTWLRVVRAIGLLAAGVAMIALRDLVLELAAVLAGLWVAYAGVSELIRLTIPPEASEQEAREHSGRRALIAAGVASAVIVAAGVLFVALGGPGQRSLRIDTVGCNGSEALCDQPLDRVAFPTAHNAMSAVSYPDFFFGMQERGIAEQMRDGIRGLLIDAHYGQPTESGQVKTDLSDLDGKEREAYERALGSEALDAALRIRDRIVNSPATGPRQVYLCHRFCEVGAVPIKQVFTEIRDFVAANPDEVLVIVIEDYVAPEDIETVAKDTGLLDYVYRGAVEGPWPTLQEMIDSGGRVLMMAENDAGGGTIPWYHEAYDGIVQETPFRFTKPEQLTEPSNLPASCRKNRGDSAGTLFLINHWIDTTPAPRPSNAKIVNTRQVLLRRIHRCERQRGLAAGLIAVDFYREGDLFGVVEKLNAERTGGG